jgi:acetyl esterase/lipase
VIAVGRCQPQCCSCGRCSTIGTRQSQRNRSTASGSGIAPSNETGWTALLGDRRGTADVSIYAAPARATDLAGLPPAYIEAGSAEVFRDEAVALANGIWEAGGSAELHIWAGGFHGFQTIVPTAAVSQTAVQTRESWVRRVLAP